MDKPKAKRGFACMSLEQRREIAASGGRAVPNHLRSYSKNKALAREAGSKGGKASPGNFANNPERAAEAGRKGGKVSTGNFAHHPERAVEAGRIGGSRPRNLKP